jgi:hypothetical protein
MDVFVRQIILQSPNAIDTTKFTQSWLKSPWVKLWAVFCSVTSFHSHHPLCIVGLKMLAKR